MLSQANVKLKTVGPDWIYGRVEVGEAEMKLRKGTKRRESMFGLDDTVKHWMNFVRKVSSRTNVRKIIKFWGCGGNAIAKNSYAELFWTNWQLVQHGGLFWSWWRCRTVSTMRKTNAWKQNASVSSVNTVARVLKEFTERYQPAGLNQVFERE